MPGDIPSLRKITLFSSLTEGTLTRLRQQAILRSYTAGQIIQYEADPASHAFFITHGRVQIYHLSPAGREQILANLHSGEAFNTVPLFQPDGANHASARALTAASLFIVSKEEFLQLIHNSPDFALALLKDFSTKLTRLTGLVEQLSLHSTRGRLARFLIDQADHSRSEPGKADLGEKADRWTQDEIAAHLGTVRDVVGRTLRSFEEAGWIKRQRNRIVLLDKKALEDEAEQ